MVGDAACTKHMPMLDQEEEDNTGKAVVRVENVGTEKGEKNTKAIHVARRETGGGVKRLADEDDDILAGRVKGSLDIEGNLESTSCKATSMNDQRREMKHVNTKEKTHETNKTNQVQESKKSNNEGRKKRYKTLALAVKRHKETSEERMKKQDHLFACVSKNLDQIDLLLGRMD